MIRIETKEIGNNGFQRIDGFVDDHHVISLRDGILDDDGKGIWTVSSSSCLVTNVKQAKLMHECIGQAFAKLDELNAL